MFTLPNGKPIDTEDVAMAMTDGNLENAYYLNTQTGEVESILDGQDTSEEGERQREEIEANSDYIPIERIPSYEAYQWMEDFVNEIVAPKDDQAAEKLSIALIGKGAFRRFKDVLFRLGEQWETEWYRWRDEQVTAAMREWFESLPIKINEVTPEQQQS